LSSLSWWSGAALRLAPLWFRRLRSSRSSTRSVRLLAPLKADLLNWRAQTRHGEDLDLIFPSPDGSPWNADRVRNWRKRAFAEAAKHAEVPNARPYEYADVVLMPMLGRDALQAGLIAA
jgi:hypothetical protein